VLHVSIWGAWSFVWGAKPTKGPLWRWDCCKRKSNEIFAELTKT